VSDDEVGGPQRAMREQLLIGQLRASVIARPLC